MTALDQARRQYFDQNARPIRIAQPYGQSQPQSQPKSGRAVNVGRGERTVCVAAGSLVAIQGLSRGTLSGILSAAAGAAMIARGATGYCPGYAAAGIDTNRE